ncbi:MAG TPA: methyltransferase [Alphaproteobacteria bacterium]|nr:methyltransferase [Alphaproteobacteria bacterium]
MTAFRFSLFIALAGLLLASAPGPVRAQAAPDYAALMADPGRSDADRTSDKRRDPVKLLAFTGARPGMTVLDMGAGGGYSSDIVARAVGPTGKVYAQNAPEFADRMKDRLAQRNATVPAHNIVAVGRPFDDPVPPDVKNLDMITFFFFYHDTTYMPVDRAQMDKKMFDALKPGGSLVIADHAAKAGDGANVGKTLHRIEKATLIKEVEAAGFKLVDEGKFFAHPEDDHTENVNQRKVNVDEFVLRFEKPKA